MQPLLLLHGAIGAASQLQELSDALAGDYRIHSMNFSGHGGIPAAAAPFSIELFADDVLRFLAENKLEKVAIFGYSMGGYVGMYLAKHYPERITKLVTLATKFEWDPAIAQREVQMLDPVKIEQKLPAFAVALKDRHAPGDWKEVLQRTADMLLALGQHNALKSEDYRTLTTPCLLLLGDRDKMVSLEETVAVYKSLPFAQMGILPGTPHPVEQADMLHLSFLIRHFLER